jgi:internalin A
MEQALRLIKEAKEKRLTRLDLCNCGLTDLPYALFELTWLEELILSNGWSEYSFEKKEWDFFESQNKGEINNIKFISPEIKTLKGLKKIIANDQKDLNDLSPLKDLQQLQELDVSSTQVSDLTPLKDLKQVQVLVVYSTQVSDLTPLKDLIQLQQLDVSLTQVSDLTPLKDLTQLQELDVSSTQVSDLTPLKDLTQLQVLSVSSTQVSDLTPLKDLTQLQKFDVSSTQVSDLSPLKDLQQLQQLHVSSTQVSDLSLLKDLQQLQKLHVQRTQVSDLSPLKDLQQLQKFDVSSTQVSDLSPLKELQQLQQLHIQRTQVSDLSPLKDLQQLQQLHVSSTQVSDLSPLKNLTQLRTLSVDSTLVSDLSPLKNLTQLRTLNVDSTDINDLISLKGLQQLEMLSFENCKIKNFESVIPFLDKKYYPNLNRLYVYGNPINDVEEKYLGTENEEVLEKLRRFYKQWQKGERRRLYEAKLILVGEGAVGKTSLKIKLKTNNKHIAKVGKQPSTEGILYEPWDLKNCSVESIKRNVRINIWDFGGQEVDHQTHQFFLSRSSFYILVSNSRLSDAQSKFDYWLNIIHKLAPDSPILMVRNLFDNQTEPYRFNEWFKKYPDQIFSKPITVDCTKKDDEGINEVLHYLRTKISELDSVGKIWPKSYADIRSDLEELILGGESYIDENRYLEICKFHEIDEEEARELSKTLHSIGTILHYQEMEELKDWIILNPEWATKAFYRIVRNTEISKAKGRFKKDQLKTIWWINSSDKKKYPVSIFDILIALMKEFDLCFQIQEKKEYIVPQLLNEEENKQAKAKVEGNDVLRFEYHYDDVIPAGMISRFICKQHNNIPKDKTGHFLYWRYGVLIERENTFALIEQPIGDKKIKVTVKGDAKRELLAIVRNAFEDLHKPLNNLKPHEILPCNCSVCINSENPFPFKYIIIKRRLNEDNVYERCDISDEKIDRRRLFNDTIDEVFMTEEKIIALIAEGKSEKAIGLLKDENLRAFLSSQFSRLNKQELLGLIDSDASNIIKNKINLSLLKHLSRKDRDGILKDYDFIPEMDKTIESKVDMKQERKTIKIFLASSNELKAEREAFELHFGARKRKTFTYDLEVVLWEDFIDAMSPTRLQDEYNKALKDCDIFVMLFFSKVGMYTAEEFEKAFGHFQENGKPLIYTYFKESNLNTANINRRDLMSLLDFQDKLKELGHFSTHYKDETDLNFQFSNQLEKLLKDKRI